MGVFKKLTGADVRVTPIKVKYPKTSPTALPATNYNNTSSACVREDFEVGVGINNEALLYNSIRQLYYGAFLSNNFNLIGSRFNTSGETIVNSSEGTFSRYDPSFQGSGPYNRNFPTEQGSGIEIVTINTSDFGESIVPGSIGGGKFTDDKVGGLLNASEEYVGNVFYDQGIIVLTSGSGLDPLTYSGSYTIYATQYKCTAEPHEFNYSLNPSALSGSSIDYDPDLINSKEFMPYVTTIGLYNENQELMMVGKLAQAVKLNPYTNTNFIIRLDR